MRSFILPGGTPGAALLHTARAVARRAERTAWAAVADHGDTISPWPAKYLNRLSDLLFILARVANAEHRGHPLAPRRRPLTPPRATRSEHGLELT